MLRHVLISFSLYLSVFSRDCTDSALLGCKSIPERPDCKGAKLYSAPDDCGCLHWYCDTKTLTDIRPSCPVGWNKYYVKDNITLCIKVNKAVLAYKSASWICNNDHSSNLFNVRRFEQLTKGTPEYRNILKDIHHQTDQTPHWSGLHVVNSKLYWSGSTPIPDRDNTDDSSSIVKFLPTAWDAIAIGRECLSFKSMSYNNSENPAVLIPDFCSAALPFICYLEIPADSTTYYQMSEGVLCSFKNDFGWVGSLNSGWCYKYFNLQLTNDDAHKVCRDKTGFLADPRYQGHISELLSNLPNGTSPLAVHVGLQRSKDAADMFVFDNRDETVNSSTLLSYGIPEIADETKTCAIFMNQRYAEVRAVTSPVRFESCLDKRPFICSKDMTVKPVTDVALSIIRNGTALYCHSKTVPPIGSFVWKKDNQYFVNQPLTPNITLNSATLKYITGDNSTRELDNADIGGQYGCEFWQEFPKKKYSSPDIAVIFADSFSLRMNAVIDSVGWTDEFEGFNLRVNFMNEMTSRIREIHERITSKLLPSMSAFNISQVQLRVKILTIRRLSASKVNVEYSVHLTGSYIEQINITNPNPTLLNEIIDRLRGVQNNETTLLDGQLMCLETTMKHPDTQEAFQLPPTTNGHAAYINGTCDGVYRVMLRANCTYVSSLEKSVWQNITFTACATDCFPRLVNHSQTFYQYNLPAAKVNAIFVGTAMCGNRNMTILNATCTMKGWEVKEKPCIATCSAEEIDHPQWPTKVPHKDMNVGERFTLEVICNQQSITILTAVCERMTPNTAEWNTTLYDSCNVTCSKPEYKSLNDDRCLVDESCPEDKIAQEYTMQKIYLPESRPGTVQDVWGDCNGQRMVMLTARCISQKNRRGRWDVRHKECGVEQLNMLNNLLKDFYDDPKELARLTGRITENIANSSAEVVSTVADIATVIAETNASKTVDVEGNFFFDIINNMASVNYSSLNLTGGNGSAAAPTRLLRSVDLFIDSAGLNSSLLEITKKNLFIQALNTSLSNGSDVKLITNDSEVSLSSNITQDTVITFVKYDSPSLFGDSKQMLGSTVISAQVAAKEIKNTDSAITFKIKVTDNITELEPSCVYWNLNESKWSKDGCTLVEKDNSSITCTCNHLTNFAVLMDIQGQTEYIEDDHHMAMSIISMIGLCISIICLGLHLLAFTFIKNLRENQFQKVLANLVAAILLLNLVFVTGVTATKNPVACIVVAVLLHYLVLVSFTWMLAEAYIQYRRFVQVFATHISHILIKVALPAWLCPLVPVVIVLIIDPQLYKGGDKFCWMKREPLYYAFLLPLACIITANIVFFGLIIKGLVCVKKQKMRTNKSEAQQRAMYLKAAIAIFVLLGMTWVFGFLAMSQATRIVFQYLFCITNSFQGLTIFVLHNVRDQKVINWWRKLFHLKPIARPDYSRSTSTLSTTKTSTLSRNISEFDDSTARSNKTLVKKITETLQLPDGRKDILQKTKQQGSVDSDASGATSTSDV